MDPEEMLEQVRTRADLADLVEALARDREIDPGGWENPDLARYLEAMAAWLRDTAADRAGPPTWAALGEALLAARVYE